MRLFAAVALAHIDPDSKAALPVLLEVLLDDKQFDPQFDAIRAVQGLGPKPLQQVVESSTRSLGDARPGVRVAAATLLGYLGMKAAAAVPALTKALKDENAHARMSAAAALGNMGPDAKSAVPALREALTDKDNLMRASAAQALTHLGAWTDVPGLIKGMQDENQTIRLKALVP